MKRVYIISRFRAKTKRERKFNERVARYYCRQVVEAGHQPVAPHLFYTQFTDDNDPEDRRRGLQYGLADLEAADYFLLIAVDGWISEGMKGELEQIAKGKGPQRGRIISITRKEAKKLLRAVKA